MDDGTDHVDELTLEVPGPPRVGRRRALWATLTAVAVAAAALVATSAGDDDTPPAGLPVALGSSVAAREASAGAADAMLAWVTYVPGDDLPTLGGEAPAYRLPTTVTEDDVSRLSDALGLEGDLVHDGPGWTVTDGNRTLEVYEDGGGTWWYRSTGGGSSVGSGSSRGSAGVDSCTETSDGVTTACEVVEDTTIPPPSTTECGPGADCVATTTIAPSPPPDVVCGPEDCGDCITSDGGIVGCGTLECPPVTGAGDCVDHAAVPTDLPSEDEARAIALDLLAATGVDVDDALVTIDGPYDAWYVSVEPRLDGVPSGLLASVSVGSGGEVTTASGYLAEAERVGSYPLLDTRAAIDRANSTSGAGDVAVASSDTADTADTPLTTTTVAIDHIDTTVPPCKPQPDGREICLVDPPVDCPSPADSAPPTTIPCDLPTCPQVVAPVDEPIEAPETIDCPPVVPDPGGVPAPAPVEVVLVDAEPSLVLLGAIDGSTDLYLVPAYRFTDADGGLVDLPAVADSALTTPPTTNSSAVDPGTPATDPPVTTCEVLVEGDASGTTHTIQPNPDCLISEPQPLAEGVEPALGVGYYVDIDTECGNGTFLLGGRVWITDASEVRGWADPGERHEGGVFTLDAADHGTFVGDADGNLLAEFRPLGPAEDIFCTPEPRR